MNLYKLQDDKRATGRTTRMVEHALDLARAGRAVYVVSRQYRELQREVDAKMPSSGILCEPTVPSHFDWRTMRGLGSHPNCVWLVDHHVIEGDPQFAAMFEMMTRYDEAGAK